MLKVAFIAAALAVGFSAHASDGDSSSPAVSTVAAEPAASAAESTAAVGVAPVGADWGATLPPRGAGLDFKEAATDSVSMLAAGGVADPRHHALPALLALGGLVVLLRKRPT